MDLTGGTCKGCWASIFDRLVNAPTDPILPRPEFCQDAAFIAFMLDQRLPDEAEIAQLPESLREAARQRTCGDPCCELAAHQKTQPVTR
jgi:hypothetical protein